MLTTIKNVCGIFKRPSASILMREELEESEKDLLSALTGLDYAKAMVEYHSSKIDRLKSMIDCEKSHSNIKKTT